jgi:adenosylcobinamide kinase / adenosylcobinamide-phosphate guanylyltransferase
MSKITLILGGARSGKSSHAQKLAQESGKSVTFIATAQAYDEEMSARIQKHQNERPQHWQALEIQTDIASCVKEIKSDIVILDCVTLLATNLMMQFVKDDIVHQEPFMKAMQNETQTLISAIRESQTEWIVVSNEAGLGLVPPYQMGRVYRDVLGWVNQKLAQKADSVLFMVAGIPMVLK